MTSKKPFSNSPPGDESPNEDEESDGAPPDDTLDDRCEDPTGLIAENKRLEALVVTERRKRAKSELKLATEKIANAKLRSKNEAAVEQWKTKLAEHKARDAAALGMQVEKLKARG
jgi:hypothetical protein